MSTSGRCDTAHHRTTAPLHHRTTQPNTEPPVLTEFDHSGERLHFFVQRVFDSQGVTSVTAYLPDARWYDYHTVSYTIISAVFPLFLFNVGCLILTRGSVQLN